MKRRVIAIKYNKIFAALSCTSLTQLGSYLYTPRIKGNTLTRQHFLFRTINTAIPYKVMFIKMFNYKFSYSKEVNIALECVVSPRYVIFQRFVAWRNNLYLLPISFVANNTGRNGEMIGQFALFKVHQWSIAKEWQ